MLYLTEASPTCSPACTAPSLPAHHGKQVTITVNIHQEKKGKKYEEEGADLGFCQDLGSHILYEPDSVLFFFLFNCWLFFLKHNGACIDLAISLTYTVKLERILNYAAHYIKPGLSSPPKVSSKVLFDLCIKTTFTR